MQQNNSKQSNQSEIELDFIGILRILLNSKRSIILCTIVAAAIGWAYSLYFNPILPPPTYKTTAVMELGSYPASDAELSIARDGRILIASMDASTSLLMALFGKERNQLTSDLLSQQVFNDLTDGAVIYFGDDIIHTIEIFEVDSQFLKIEVLGAAIDIVKNKTNEIIEYLKSLHVERMDEVMLRKNRELQNIEEKLLTIGKFINDISEQNDMYISDVAELKLKEIEYKYQLNELNLNLNNIINFKPTNIAGETKLETIYPDEVDEPKMVIISFILGFILSSLFFLLRHAIALANNKT